MISLTHNRSLTPQTSQRILQIYHQNFTISCQFLQLTVGSHIPVSVSYSWHGLCLQGLTVFWHKIGRNKSWFICLRVDVVVQQKTGKKHGVSMNPIVCCIRVTTLCVYTALTTYYEPPHSSLSEHTLRDSSLCAPPYCQLPYWRPSISLPFKAQALNTNGRGLGDRGRGTAPISPGALL